MVYDPTRKPENPYARIYANFTAQTQDHALTVLLDDGLNRQMRVGAPESGIWSWQVCTWKGYLATIGDVANGFVFTRIEDMIDFFDRSGRHQGYYADSAPSIDFRYWAEKLSGNRWSEVRSYSEDAFLQSVRDHLSYNDDLGDEAQAEYTKTVEIAKRVCARNGIDYEAYLVELRATNKTPDVDLEAGVSDEFQYFGLPIAEQSPAERASALLADARENAESEQIAREWLQEDEQRAVFGDDTWEWDLRDYEADFIIAGYAIELSVRLWREYEASPAAIAHRDPSRSYVLVSGGAVQNDPSLPVFDLDILNDQSPNAASASEAVEIYERIRRHSAAKQSLAETLRDLEAFIRAHGTPEHLATIDEYAAAELDTPLPKG